MKINSIQPNNSINAYNKQKQSFPTEKTNKVTKDKVVISENAKYLNKINAENEDLNLDKINEIKKRIQEGTYSVDSRKLAEKIIESIKGDKSK